MMASKRHVFVFQITWMTDSRLSRLVAVPATGSSMKTWSGVREAAVGDCGRMAADMANYIFLFTSYRGKLSVLYTSEDYVYAK